VHGLQDPIGQVTCPLTSDRVDRFTQIETMASPYANSAIAAIDRFQSIIGEYRQGLMSSTAFCVKASNLGCELTSLESAKVRDRWAILDPQESQ